MDIKTGTIYPSLDAALAAGVPERDLMTAVHRETLEELQKRLNLTSKHVPHSGERERSRRRKRLEGAA